MEIRQEKELRESEMLKWLEDDHKFDGFHIRSRPSYTEEGSKYYYEEGSDQQLLMIEGTEFYWSEPVCGLRDRETDSLDVLLMLI